MLNLRCIARFKNEQGRIVGYRLIDDNGVTKDIGAKELKTVLSNGEALVLNLSLTADGRLIPSAPNLKASARKVERPEDKLYKSREPKKVREDNRPKVLAFDSGRDTVSIKNMTDALIDVYNNYGNNALISKFGYRKYKDLIGAHIWLVAKETDTSTDEVKKVNLKFAAYEAFTIEKGEPNRFAVGTLSESWDARSLDDVENDIAATLERLKDTPNIEFVDSTIYNFVPSYKSWRQYGEEFNLSSYRNERFNTLILAGNVIYLEPMNLSLAELTIPDCVSLVSINAFDNCPNLKKIRVPNNLLAKQVTNILKELDRTDIKIDRTWKNGSTGENKQVNKSTIRDRFNRRHAK